MSLKVGMLFLTDALDDYGSAYGPNEMHVRRVNHHAILIGGVEANRCTDAEVLCTRNLLLSLYHFIFQIKID